MMPAGFAVCRGGLVASIIDGLENVWDFVFSGVQAVLSGAEHRREQEQRVNQLTASSGDRFRIEPEQVPQVIADLDEALKRVQLIRSRAEWLAFTSAPGYDEVSLNAVRQIGEMAMGDQGSLRAALDAYEQEIIKTKDKLRAQLQTYLGIEQVNVPPATAWPSG
jgi:hypothetical protein